MNSLMRSALLFLFFALFAVPFSVKSQVPDAIINEWSQGTTGKTAEWVEILITNTDPGGFSLAGWSLQLPPPKGKLFQFAPTFPRLPAGTLVVVYMNPGKCGPCTFPDDYAPNMPAVNALKGCDFIFDPNDTKFVTINDWENGTKNSSNSNNQDNYLLYDAGGNLAHDWDFNNDPAFLPKRPGGAQAVYFTGGGNQYSDPAFWTRTAWNGAVTPGQPNGGGNTNYIQSLIGAQQSVVIYNFDPVALAPINEGQDLRLTFRICPPPTADGFINFDTEPMPMPVNPATYGIDYESFPARTGQDIVVPVRAGQDTFSFVIRASKDCITEGDENITLIAASAEYFLDNEDIKIVIKDVPVPQNKLKIVADPPGPVCTGTPVRFKVVNEDGTDLADPTAFTYQWRADGTADGFRQDNILNPLFNKSQTGTYRITVAVGGPCPPGQPDPISIEYIAAPTVTLTPSNAPYCVGDPFTLTANVVPAGTYTYVWKRDGNVLPDADGILNISSLTGAGTASFSVEVSVQGNAACSDAETLAVTIGTKPVFTPVLSKPLFCPDDPAPTITIENFPAGTTFTVSSSPPDAGLQLTTNEPNRKVWNLSPSQNTSYSVIGRDPASGCSETQILTVEVENIDPIILANPSTANDTYCAGEGPITLTATNKIGNFPAGTTYLWSPGGETTQSITINRLTADITYTVAVTGPRGCVKPDIIDLKVNPLPDFSDWKDKVSFCNTDGGVTVDVTPANAGVTLVSWTPNVNVQTVGNPADHVYRFSPAATTPYTATFRLGDCEITKEIEVQVIQGLQITAPQNPGFIVNVCENDADGVLVELDLTQGNRQQATFTWVANAGTPVTINAVSPDPAPSWRAMIMPPAGPVGSTATIEVTASLGGCESQPITLTVNKVPAADIPTLTVNNPAVCVGQPITLNVICNNCRAVNGVTWSNSADPGWTSNDASPTYTTVNAGVITFTVVGVTDNGCEGRRTIDVTVNELPTVTFTPAAPLFCVGAQIRIEAVPGAGQTIANYQWSSDDGFTQTGSNATVSRPNATTQMAGKYSVTFTDNNGCTGTAEVNVVVNTSNIAVAIRSNAVNNQLCEGNNLTLTADPATFAAYEWTLADGSKNTTAGSTLSITNLLTSVTPYTYSLKVTDANGCSGTASYSVTVNPRPTIPGSITATAPPMCAGETRNVNVQGSGYTWNPTTGVTPGANNEFVLNPTATTVYTLTRTDATTGCTNTATLTVTVNPRPVITRTGTENACLNVPITLKAGGAVPASFVWEANASAGTPETNGEDLVFTPTVIQTYTFTVRGTGANGCTASASITVSVNAQPTFGNLFSGRKKITEGDTTRLVITGSDAATVEWEPAGSVNVLAGNIFEVIATPRQTTTFTATVVKDGCREQKTVQVEVEKYRFEIPSVFTPNNDGANDNLVYFFDNNNIRNFSIVIFDRWGQKVYESNNLTDFWNGKLNNSGDEVPEGTYFVSMKITRVDGAVLEKTQSLTLLR